MAVLVRLAVTPATQEQFDQLDASVGQSLTQADGEAFVDEVLRPLLSDLGLTVALITRAPVWAFARP